MIDDIYMDDPANKETRLYRVIGVCQPVRSTYVSVLDLSFFLSLIGQKDINIWPNPHRFLFWDFMSLRARIWLERQNDRETIGRQP
jgi:hypothetical protein